MATLLQAVPALLGQNNGGAGLFAGLGALMIVLWVVGIALTIFWIWMLVDCLTSAMPTNEKILWAIVMLIVPGFGSLIFFFVKRGSPGGTHAGPTLTA